MKKAIIPIAASILLLSSCGITDNLTSNHNLNQTQVVLSQANYHIVKTVETTVSSTYIFGIGGLSKKAARETVVNDLYHQAEMTGSQAIVNIAVKENVKLIYPLVLKETFSATGTVIEFDR